MKEPPLITPASREALERVRAIAERRLTAEEFNAYVEARMSESEREEIFSLVSWFSQRYPTPGERLASARRAYRQWVQNMPSGPIG